MLQKILPKITQKQFIVYSAYMAVFCSNICKYQQISISSKNTACSKIISNTKILTKKKKKILAFIWASQVALVVKNPPANTGDTRDMDLIPGLGRSPGEGNDNPLQYSCLKNAMARGSWQVTLHGVAKSQTRLSDWAHMRAITSGDFLLPFLLLSLERKWERLEAWNLMCHSWLWRLGSHKKEP